MAFLTLRDIGKIYASEGSVAVGIRGVNLSFEKGEFVAVTGKSGSGKSTLLNVISGMDTYEEGELLIDGQETSHYIQKDWEAYREEYISFIFQDYNIIDSFTVLENVELALMHMEDRKARRKKALELLSRVGLEKFLHQKGSRLSGGQKQRTVIARALAKDSPIILADEPTGNLDAATSAEIVALLKEVSRDKLLIMVTHNFDQVEEVATRHIRIFDGAVESDKTLAPPFLSEEAHIPVAQEGPSLKKDVGKGLDLGLAIFRSKPKLTVFLCVLLALATVGTFFATGLFFPSLDAFSDRQMFRSIEGRLVLTKDDGSPITEGELAALVEKHGAEEALHYDMLLDAGSDDWGGNVAYIPTEDTYFDFYYAYGEELGEVAVGSYPTEKNQVFLYLPISFRPIFGDEKLQLDRITIGNVSWQVSGVGYYYDNRQTPRILFSKEGFAVATAAHFLTNACDPSLQVELFTPKVHTQYGLQPLVPTFALAEDKFYPDLPQVWQLLSEEGAEANFYYTVSVYKTSQGMTYNEEYTAPLEETQLSKTPPSEKLKGGNWDAQGAYYVGAALAREMAEDILSTSYRQASLFFRDNAAALAAQDAIEEEGYIAVLSTVTYSPSALTLLAEIIAAVFTILGWVLFLLFIAFFVRLCTSRVLGAFRGDMAIMRSMGISVRVIKIGMYVRMLISLVPGLILMGVLAVLVFTSPTFNSYFVYLPPWQYGVIAAGLLLVVWRITHHQVRRLFGESVKKALRGGNVQ